MTTEIPSRLQLTELRTGSVELRAPNDTGKRTFSMLAYTGAVVETLAGPLVIDLAGMEVGGKRKPILREHDRKSIAGYSSEISVTPDGLLIEGVLSKTTPAGQEVAALADEGFPWQASVGIDIGDAKFLNDNDMMTVNGAEFTGPGIVITKSTLKESSFVPLGADGATSAAVFADGFRSIALTQEPKTMASEKTEPAAEAIADAENAGFKRGYDQAKADISEMFAAFPTDMAFAWQQFTAGVTVEKAKAQAADRLVAELAEAKAKLAEAEAKLAATPAVTAAAPVAVQLAADETPKTDPNDPISSGRIVKRDEKTVVFYPTYGRK